MSTEEGQATTPKSKPAEVQAGGAHADAGLSHEQLLLTLQDAQAKADQHWNQLLLARAEVENVRRRAERDIEGAHKYALERFVNELLPVKDSLELGLAAAGEGADVAKLREGIELTLKMLAAARGGGGGGAGGPAGGGGGPGRRRAGAGRGSRDAEPEGGRTGEQKGET